MKTLYKIIMLILIVVFLSANTIYVLAHSEMLGVTYDECRVPVDDGNIIEMDGEDEMWYALYNSTMSHHLSHEVYTIRYYFSEFAKNDNTYTWTTDYTFEEAEAIKEAYANSMKKWNNVYYYTYDEYGTRIAKKIINVEEGTEKKNNLTIYPINTERIESEGDTDYYAITGTVPNTWEHIPDSTANPNEYKHYHYSDWYMKVNLDYFKSNYEHYSFVIEGTGAHELGHVLGLRDVDTWCSSADLQNHHEEILMGYGNGTRSTYAKYKDIAGVSITRGFHTDDDHVWMLRTNGDGTQDVICAQCNGVRKNITLTNGTYEGEAVNIYKSCVHHGGINQKMLLVATDGIRDFYKCQYCRYILETEHTTHHFDDATCINDNTHVKKCVVCNYSTTTVHNSIYTHIDTNNHLKTCTLCNLYLIEVHNYSEYQRYSSAMHINACKCGKVNGSPSPHIVKLSDVTLNIGHCMYCGAKVMLGDDFVQVPFSTQKVTINGSYILPSGIIVLVDEDIEAYENGTLVFYDKDKLPQTQ